jgi:catechol 2,3-dioxygenase-like lactoylglutathione lyase family enzyme
MKRVTGIGGVFFRARDVAALTAWYREHLGIESGPDGSAIFQWKDAKLPDEGGMTVWSAFAEDTKYFGPGNQPFMINYLVEDLDGLLAALRAEGVWIDDKREDHAYGRFAWIKDPEGNRVELWEPPKS